MSSLKNEKLRPITPDFIDAYKEYTNTERPLENHNPDEIRRELAVLGFEKPKQLAEFMASWEFSMPLKPEEKSEYLARCKSLKSKAQRIMAHPEKMTNDIYEMFCDEVKRVDDFDSYAEYMDYISDVPLFDTKTKDMHWHSACYYELQARLLADTFFTLDEEHQKTILVTMLDMLSAAVAKKEHFLLDEVAERFKKDEESNQDIPQDLKYDELATRAAGYLLTARPLKDVFSRFVSDCTNGWLTNIDKKNEEYLESVLVGYLDVNPYSAEAYNLKKEALKEYVGDSNQ